MKITTTIKVECCNGKFEFSSSSNHEVIEALLNHVKINHKPLYERLERKGRRLAMSQNGCGYYDSGKGEQGGWWDAQPPFRQAWIENALEDELNENNQ